MHAKLGTVASVRLLAPGLAAKPLSKVAQPEIQPKRDWFRSFGNTAIAPYIELLLMLQLRQRLQQIFRLRKLCKLRQRLQQIFRRRKLCKLRQRLKTSQRHN